MRFFVDVIKEDEIESHGPVNQKDVAVTLYYKLSNQSNYPVVVYLELEPETIVGAGNHVVQLGTQLVPVYPEYTTEQTNALLERNPIYRNRAMHSMIRQNLHAFRDDPEKFVDFLQVMVDHKILGKSSYDPPSKGRH